MCQILPGWVPKWKLWFCKMLWAALTNWSQLICVPILVATLYISLWLHVLGKCYLLIFCLAECLSFRLQWYAAECIRVLLACWCAFTRQDTSSSLCKIVLAPSLLSAPTSGRQDDTAPPLTLGKSCDTGRDCSSKTLNVWNFSILFGLRLLPVPVSADSVMWLKECLAFWWDLWPLLLRTCLCSQCPFTSDPSRHSRNVANGLTLSLPVHRDRGGCISSISPSLWNQKSSNLYTGLGQCPVPIFQ